MRKPQDAATVAKRLLSAASKPFSIRNYEFHVGMSIGISIYPDDAENAPALIKNADVAMYHAKKDGKGAFHF
ncbi:MAG: diguanylate cyclase, partial [Candidatus Latescibacteria bacterium]|nr:diguanylate cyclase [Candidatus Latescibacterota bacterium]NIO77478.1 diguanylate cyclase [Candidatus Latescibacterota bacterium]